MNDTPHSEIVERIANWSVSGPYLGKDDAEAIVDEVVSALAALQPDRPGSHLAVTDEMGRVAATEASTKHRDSGCSMRNLADEIVDAYRAALVQAPAADAEQRRECPHDSDMHEPSKRYKFCRGCNAEINACGFVVATPTSPTGETAVREALETAPLHLVWNAAGSECVGFLDEMDANWTAKGGHAPLNSTPTIGEAFREAYGDDAKRLPQTAVDIPAEAGRASLSQSSPAVEGK